VRARCEADAQWTRVHNRWPPVSRHAPLHPQGGVRCEHESSSASSGSSD
jgi:hypothetical protein